MKSSALLQRPLWVGALCALPLFALAETVIIPLHGFQEVPVVSTTARGAFVANLQSNAIHYELRYDALQGNVLQAHIHLGQ